MLYANTCTNTKLQFCITVVSLYVFITFMMLCIKKSVLNEDFELNWRLATMNDDG